MTDQPTPPPLPEPTAPATPQKLSPLKWLAGILMLVAVMVTCGGFGLFVGGPPKQPVGPPNPLAGVVSSVLGVACLALGAALYGLTLLTGCFTLSFRRPFFTAFKAKLWVANLVVGLLLQLGCALMMAPWLFPLVARALPGQVAVVVAMMGPFVAAQLVFIWFNMWAPLDGIVIRRRLLARGLLPAQLEGGRLMGTSDPQRSSIKKMTLIEEDFGMLWIGADRLTFWGDEGGWEIPHGRLLAVERKADAGSTSAYFGAVHVILRHLDAAGVERLIRLHTEGDWTQTGRARALNAVAERLAAWRDRPLPGWVREPGGFAVTMSS